MPLALPAVAIAGIPAGTVLIGAASGGALVQPLPTNSAGVVAAAGTASPAVQAGGTDSLPTDDALPALASIGAAPTPLRPAEPTGLAAPLALTSAAKPVALDTEPPAAGPP